VKNLSEELIEENSLETRPVKGNGTTTLRIVNTRVVKT